MNDSPRPTHSELYGDECRRLKAEGLNYTQIGKVLGINDKAVKFVLADETERERIRSQKRGGKKKSYYGFHHDPKAAPKPVKAPPPVAIAKEVKDAACLAFARGDIARDELMRRITPQASA